MDDRQRRLLLGEIEARWRALGDDVRPEAVWIRQHAAVEGPEYHTDTPVIAVWLLDARGLQPRDPTKFVHFWAIKMDQTWDGAMNGAAGSLSPRNDPRWPGHVAFAEIAGSDHVYLEVMWGRRSCPRGVLASVEEAGVVEQHQVWVG